VARRLISVGIPPGHNCNFFIVLKPTLLCISVGDPNPDPQDPHVFGPPGFGSAGSHVFGPPGSGSSSQRYDLPFSRKGVERTEK
jgi:hypothetical protein